MIYKIFLALCVLALIALPILNWMETKLVYKDDGYGVARRKAVDAEMALGASYGSAQDTLFLREMLARVRREASDLVQRDGAGMWLMAITNAKAAAVGEIGAYKPHLAKRFSDSIDALTYGDILYPAEAKMVDRLFTGAVSRPNPDERAALRIVR